ncbi:MAG: exodeoxyribonuclease VII large subunit [Acidobacteria bacterium]|nr:exodeoxyribonuclease VII large subunit [Acidobacteriota bacterium]
MRTVRSVSEVIANASDALAAFGDVWIEGEVSNFVRAASGHLYFSLKDARASISAVMFAGSAARLRFRIENGQKLICRGRLSIYEARGQFQIKLDHAEPSGIGALTLAFEQLKAKLAEEGLFDPLRKKPLPMLPQRIAVVTSLRGAAIRDVLNVLGRRFEGLSIQIYPVHVQGSLAASEIARAVNDLSRWKLHDVVIVCRGGGSLEDLWPFNEEVVARAVAGCAVPTISGVGHEPDFTICDFVADKRAASPSAAAEIVVQAKDEIVFRIDSARRRIREQMERRVTFFRSELRHLVSAEGLWSVPLRVERTRRQLDSSRLALRHLLLDSARRLRARLAAADEPLLRFPARLALPQRRAVLAQFDARAASLVRARLDRSRATLAAAAGRLEAVSPLSVLSRGYAIAYSLRGRKRPILDASSVARGEAIEVQLRHGSLGCTVDSVINEPGDGSSAARRNTTEAPPARREDDDGTQPR